MTHFVAKLRGQWLDSGNNLLFTVKRCKHCTYPDDEVLLIFSVGVVVYTVNNFLKIFSAFGGWSPNRYIYKVQQSFEELMNNL